MMTNLFSVFDPTTYILSVPFNWLSTLLGLIMIPIMVWAIPSRYHFLWTMVLSSLHKEFKTLMGPNSHKGSTFIFISIFSMVLLNNFLGLFPYVFTSTSHLTMTLSLALPMWISFMIYGWINHTNHMFAHLVPKGTPSILMPFMVCIETTSNLIRPLTLAVRLTANMIAGHLLLTLLGNLGPVMTFYFIPFLTVVQIALLMLESAVAIIQAYVFAILSVLYASEVN